MRQPRIKGAHRRQRRTAGSTARCCTRLRNGGKALRPDKGTKPERSVHRGSRGASLQTPRAERRGTGVTWRIQGLCTHDLLRTRGHRAFGAPAFRAPSNFFEGLEWEMGIRAHPAPAKQYGRRSFGYFTSPACGGGRERSQAGGGPSTSQTVPMWTGPLPTSPASGGGEEEVRPALSPSPWCRRPPPNQSPRPKCRNCCRRDRRRGSRQRAGRPDAWRAGARRP
jgi:hypothetical protein